MKSNRKNQFTIDDRAQDFDHDGQLKIVINTYIYCLKLLCSKKTLK